MEDITPQQAANWAQEHKTIHNESGMIADVGAAHDIASVEKNQGRDDALAREGELQRQAETGLTDEERRNIEVMDGVAETYPHATIQNIDEKGRKTLIIRPKVDGDTGSTWIYILNQSGAYAVNLMNIGYGSDHDKLDWTKMNDQFSEAKFSGFRGKEAELSIAEVVSDKQAKETARGTKIKVIKADLADKETGELYKMRLQLAQDEGEALKDNEESARESSSTKSILSNLGVI